MNDEPVIATETPSAPLTADQIDAITAEAEEQAQAELDGDTSKIKPSAPVKAKTEEPELVETPTEAPAPTQESTEKSVDFAPAPVAPVKPVENPAPSPTPGEQPVRFDVAKYTERVNDTLKAKVYKDDDNKDITEEQAYEQYGHVLGPIRDRMEAVVVEIGMDMKEAIDEIRKDLEPAKAVAATLAASIAVEAENKMLAALEKAGASDARALLSDPRMIEFVQKNPQYNNLISTDADNADRVNDLLFLIDRFRSKAGIAKPAASTTTAKKAARTDNSIIAAQSSARGGGSPARDQGDAGKSPEQMMMDEEERLIEEQKQSRKQFGV